jgi:hypothetical protein
MESWNWKVKCASCGAEYVMQIVNFVGLRKAYCLYCSRVGVLKLVKEEEKNEAGREESSSVGATKEGLDGKDPKSE